MQYNPKNIESKWQKIWRENGSFEPILYDDLDCGAEGANLENGWAAGRGCDTNRVGCGVQGAKMENQSDLDSKESYEKMQNIESKMSLDSKNDSKNLRTISKY